MNTTVPCLVINSDVTDSVRRPGHCHSWVNSSPPGQNGRLFTDDIFRCIFVNEKFCILMKISLKFVPKSPINNNLVLVQIMAWR